nr:helix-turn-helix transcriptional regulator [uncultured Agathobaculum sp.]
MNRIKELRQKKGDSVKKVADEVGLSQSMLSSYENGTRSPRDEGTWDKLANYFGVSISYLMGLTDKIISPPKGDALWRPQSIIIDAKRVQKDYINGQKPLEIEIASIDEYLLLANITQLYPDEIKELLKTVQSWIREKHKGWGTVIQLPEDDSFSIKTN